MPNLKKLVLRYNQFRDDYCLQNLGCFNKLKSLYISLSSGSKWCDVAPSLTFPPSLEELELRNCHLGWEDLTLMISSLPHLGSLQLSRVRGSEWNLDGVEFCCKILEIYCCDDFIYLNANSSHFPVLQSLDLYDIPGLSEIPFDIGEIPTLKLISLTDCSASAAISAVRMVVEQETDYGNYDIQLRVEFWEHNRQDFDRFQEMLKEECLTTNSLHLHYNCEKVKTF